MPSNLCKCLQVTKKKGERNTGLPGLQAISLLSLFSPIANKWGPITRRLQNIELDSGRILGEDLVLWQHLPHTRIPTSFYLFIFSQRRALINGVCLAVVVFYIYKYLAFNSFLLWFLSQSSIKFKTVWASRNTVWFFWFAQPGKELRQEKCDGWRRGWNTCDPQKWCFKF